MKHVKLEGISASKQLINLLAENISINSVQ